MRCLVRRKEVVATPEERVRQRLLSYMTGPLGYPLGRIAVEVPIPGAERRADIIVYGGKDALDLSPLLLVECKAASLSEVAERQLLGYNLWVEAGIVALAGDRELRFATRKKGKWVFREGLPSWECIFAPSSCFTNTTDLSSNMPA